MQRKFVGAVRDRSDPARYTVLPHVGETGLFEGYASVFDVVDLSRDKVLPMAFAASLRDRPASAIKLLWQHEPAQPLGVWLRVEEDQRGLYVRGRLNLDIARAREIHALMREGAVDGLSIGYRPVKFSRDRATGVRSLAQIGLWEISIVTFPMLPQARVSAVKRGDYDHGGRSKGAPQPGRNVREVIDALRRAAEIFQ